MKKKNSINKKSFFLNIVVPALFSQLLFIGLIFAVIIPYFNHNLIEAKKEMILEIINTSICIADKNYQDAFEGKVTFDYARQNAIRNIESIRYGTAGKDYIWITDNAPVMIMHPYRKDLIGKNIENFTDLNGKKMFAEMVQKVKENGEGYVNYMWQWMDDSTKIVPKISYIKEYKNWNWILGTGVYIEDVRDSISRVTKSMLWISLGIFIVISFMLLIIAKRNLKVERERNIAESNLKESNEKYKALVEASIDGTLMFLNNVCVYRNKQICDLIDCSNSENIKPNLQGIIAAHLSEDISKLGNFLENNDENFKIESQITDKSGILKNVLINCSKIYLSGDKGLIIIIKDLSHNSSSKELSITLTDILSNVSESTGVGIFRALSGRKSRLTEVNNNFLSILGYNSIDEISNIQLFGAFEDPVQRKEFVNQLFANGIVKDFQCRILRKNGSAADILVSAAFSDSAEEKRGHIDGIIKDVSDEAKITRKNDELLSKFISHSALWDMPVSSLEFEEIASCPQDITIEKALELMNFYKTDLLLVNNIAGNINQLISKESLIGQLLSSSNGKKDKVDISSAEKIIPIQPETTVLNCLLKMYNEGRSYAAINHYGEVKVLRFDSVRKVLGSSTSLLFEKLNLSESIDEIIQIHNELPLVIKHLANVGSDLSIMTSVITGVSDKISSKIISNAILQCGNPPCRFSFLALGSEGRSEQGLYTDQDNAIIYEDLNPENKEIAALYFQKLASIINPQLDKAGYMLCSGGIMANNPKWNQPLQNWKKYFSKWITVPEPQNLIDSSIFFDFRCIYGDDSLANDLRLHIKNTLAENPAFLSQAAIMTINYKLPVSMFGKIQTEQKDDNESKFNLKNAIRLLVNIVRLYAMNHGIEETNTLRRLEALYSNGNIPLNFYRELKYCFIYLMNIQFADQINNYHKKNRVSNYIDLSVFTNTELLNFKNVLSNISTFQSKIKYDFGVNQ